MKYKLALSTLEASFLRFEGDPSRHRCDVPRIEANGVLFLCPACYVTNNGPVGTHSVMCWNESVPLPPAGPEPSPGRWRMFGISMQDLMLSPSVHLTGAGCGWHGWIKQGRAVW